MGQKSLTNNEGIESAIAGMKETMDEIARFYVGDPRNVKLIMGAIMASGHVLLEDFPGVGKTFLAKLTARTLGLDYNRIQFTPDLLPGDITGTKIWMPALGKFEKSMGPINSNLILADEINRAPPKTQAALLEAMEERQVTIEGETVQLPRPFIVLATQNPIEFEGTYPLPEAQMDRFMIRINLGYPEDEEQLLNRRISWQNDDPSGSASKVLDSKQVLSIRNVLERQILVSKEIITYISGFAACRKDRRVMAGPSPRGLISMLRMSRAMAMIEGRDFVTPDDVKSVALETLAHRIVIKPEMALDQVDSESVVKEYLEKIPVPR
ncbi:MAG: MoxR family ATPase [Candidatus Thermoplasmatota archaeon]|nr:MoxR family ATPase [Candidatus Thermoplasmatota archaeon]